MPETTIPENHASHTAGADVVPETSPAKCIGCDYALAGLPMSGTCPECGQSVERSIHGSLMRFAPGEHLDRLERGASLVLLGIFLFYALTFIGAFIMLPLGLIGTLIALIGWRRFAARDPRLDGAPDRDSSGRRLVQTTVIISIVSGVVAALGLAAGIMGLVLGAEPPFLDTERTAAAEPEPLAQALMYSSIGTMLLGGAAFGISLLIRFFAAVNYLAWLARRLPNERLLGQAKRLRWLGPLLAILGTPLLGLGSLIATILYYTAIRAAREDLRHILRLRRDAAFDFAPPTAEPTAVPAAAPAAGSPHGAIAPGPATAAPAG